MSFPVPDLGVTWLKNFEFSSSISETCSSEITFLYNLIPVSYTHLDVYKRQLVEAAADKTKVIGIKCRPAQANDTFNKKEMLLALNNVRTATMKIL